MTARLRSRRKSTAHHYKKPGNTLRTLVRRGRLGPTATAPRNLRPRLPLTPRPPAR